MFQLLKYFEGEQEIIGTVIIPNGLLLLLTLLPLLGYGRLRRFGHVVGILVVGLLAVGVVTLTGLAIAEDHAATEAAKTFQKELKTADNYWKAYTNAPGARMEFTVNNKPAREGAWKIRVTPVSAMQYGNLQYERWVDERRILAQREQVLVLELGALLIHVGEVVGALVRPGVALFAVLPDVVGHVGQRLE